MRPLIFFLALLISFSAIAATTAKRLVFLGDSLTEGYGVAREAAFPFLIQQKIKADGKDWVVVNAGISGSTSASALSRLRLQLKNRPDLLVLALGANDGLRGLQVHEMEKNLRETIELAQKEKIRVILVGMQMPPNYSKKYTEEFRAVFPRLAKKYNIPLIPFLLDGVGGQPELNQADGIHPNEKGHAIIAGKLYEQLKRWL